MLQRNDLQNLSIQQLRAIETAIDSYLFKQPDFGEPYHQNYRKNTRSFDLLIKQTSKLERIVRKYFQKQKEKISALVHLHKFTAAEDDYINSDAWDIEDPEFAGEIADGIFPIYTNGAQTQAEELKIGTQVDAEAAPSQKFLSDYSLKLAKDINKTTKNDIKEAIQTSLKVGENRDELTSRLNDILDDEYRSQMIAQTESIRAFTQGRLDVGREIGYQYKQWNTQDGACEFCSDLDGKIIGIDENFASEIGDVDGCPLHPNCRCYITLVKSIEAAEYLVSIKAGWVTLKDGRHILIDDGPNEYGMTPHGFAVPNQTTIVEQQPAAPQEKSEIINPASVGEQALDRMDYSQPTKVPANGEVTRYHMEHMIKYNAALQADAERKRDPSIPANIKDLIYNANVGGNIFPVSMAQHMLESLPGDLQNNQYVKTALMNWGKSAQMIWDTKLRFKK